MKWLQHLNAVLFALSATLLALTGSAGLQAQDLVRGIETRAIPLFNGDTVDVEILYAEREIAPFVVILPDRYGIQISMRQLMRSFADAGYHTAAFHLLTKVAHGTVDSTIVLNDADPGRIIEGMVEIRNDARGRDKVGLLAFDVGAVAGMIAEARIPLFAACAMFYPSERESFLDALQKCNIPVEVNIGREDPLFPESEMLDLKMRYMSKTNPIVFRYYDAGRFFFNPGYPGFNVQAMQRGIDKSAFFLRQHLR